MSEIRTRFAPSPTGDLHIGSARTALYNYLYAKRFNGTFILRIEDTDRERSTQKAIDVILEGMHWLGLHHDEGPFYQTQHFERYKEVIEFMLEKGLAYRCYCTKERLEKLREQQLANKEKPRYDGLCRYQPPKHSSEPSVIRFMNPEDGEVHVNDQVHGRVIFKNKELDDFIIARSDGTPTYNFTVVVDDWDMKITHVIRGDDHLNNTPKQMNLLAALGAPIPVYAHVPMILGQDGKKLSKRHGATNVMVYRNEGYLPQALLNYLVRLGWSHGNDEIFTLAELIRLFDIKDLNHSAAALNPEKLLWLNQHYLKTLDVEEIAQQLQWHFNDQKIAAQSFPDLQAVIKAQCERTRTLAEMAARSRYFYEEPSQYSHELLQKHFSQEVVSALKEVLEKLTQLDTWQKENIHQIIQTICDATGLKFGKIGPAIRLAVTGDVVSPPVDLTLALLGQTQTISRIQKCLIEAETLLQGF